MRIDRGLQQMEVVLGGICLALMFGVLLVNVLLRYLFGYSIFWAEELAVTLFVWMGFLASAWCAGENGHIRLTLVVDRLPPRARAAVDTLVEASLIVTLALIVLRSGDALATLQLTVAMRLPEQILYAIVPVTLIATALHVLVRMIRRFRGLPADGPSAGGPAGQSTGSATTMG